MANTCLNCHYEPKWAEPNPEGIRTGDCQCFRIVTPAWFIHADIYTDGKKVWIQYLNHDLRRKKRLTLKEVSEATGLMLSEISEYEHNVGWLEPEKALHLLETLKQMEAHK